MPRLILLGLLSLNLAWGDKIVLKSGETFEGDFFGGTSQQINFVVNGKLMFFNAAEVASVHLAEPTGPIASEAAKSPDTPCPPCPNECPDAAAAAPAEPEKVQEGHVTVRRPRDDRPETDDARPEDAEPADAEPEPAVTGERITIPAGTPLVVRILQEADLKNDRIGSAYRGTLAQAVKTPSQDGQGDRVTIPAGAGVVLSLVDRNTEDDVQGSMKIGLEATEISYRGQRVPVRTTRAEDKGRTTKDRVNEGLSRAGAALGRVLGGVAGREVGSTTEETIEDTWNKASVIEADTELDFTLAEGVEVSWPVRPEDAEESSTSPVEPAKAVGSQAIAAAPSHIQAERRLAENE